MRYKRRLGISYKQLKIGTKIEMEHTKNPRYAKKIALDHLKEHPQYYTYLTAMEKKMKTRKKRKTYKY